MVRRDGAGACLVVPADPPDGRGLLAPAPSNFENPTSSSGLGLGSCVGPILPWRPRLPEQRGHRLRVEIDALHVEAGRRASP
jgi:hypothetical protein